MMNKIVLEINRNYLKIMEISLTKNGLAIKKAYEAPLPLISNDNDLSMAIRDAKRASGIKGRRVILAIPEDQIISRILDLPPMPEKDIYKIALDEFSTFKIFQGDFPVIQLIKLAELETGERYLVIGSPRKNLLRWIKVIKNSGMRIVSIDKPSLSAYRSLTFSQDERVEQPNYVFIYTGEEVTTLFFIKDGELLFVRELSFGINDILNDEDELNSWINEISGTFSYYLRESKGVISYLYLSGSNNSNHNYLSLLEILKTRLNLSAKLINPYTNLDLSPELIYLLDKGSNYSSLVGLAFNFKEQKFYLNLIPKDVREYNKDFLKIAVATLLILVIALGATYLTLYFNKYRLSSLNSIKEVKANLALVDNSLLEQAHIEHEFNVLRAEEEQWNTVFNQLNQIDLKKAFLEIFRSAEGKVGLTNVVYEDGKVIHIHISSIDFSSIYEFRDKLISSNLFLEVKISNIGRDEKFAYSQLIVEVKSDGN